MPLAEFLIEYESNINARDANGQTPIFYTAKKGQSEMTKLLIDHGANVNDVDHDNKSPLQEAIDHKAKDVVRILLDHGANSNETTTHSGGAAEQCVAKTPISST